MLLPQLLERKLSVRFFWGVPPPPPSVPSPRCPLPLFAWVAERPPSPPLAPNQEGRRQSRTTERQRGCALLYARRGRSATLPLCFAPVRPTFPHLVHLPCPHPPSLPAPPCRVVSAGRRAGSAPYCYFRDLFFFLGRCRPFLTNCLCAYVKLFRLSCSTCEALRNFPRIRFRPDVDISRRQRLVRAV